MKRYIQFFLVVMAAGAIFPLVYLRTNYQETILSAFKMTLDDLNIIYTVLGFVYILGYFPSGILCDKFSTKKLLVFSLLGTSVGGYWFAQIPNYTSVIAIFCIWGFFTVFTFWGAHLKMVKLLSTPEEEGRFFGFLDGGRGVIEAVLASISLMIFSYMLQDHEAITDKKAALQSVVYLYSTVLLVVGILIALFVEDDKPKEKINTPNNAIDIEEKGFQLDNIKIVLKNKLVYIIGGIIFCSYAITWIIYSFGGFMESTLKISPVGASTIMVIVLWMRPIGGGIGGYLADKFGKTKTLIGSLLGATLCLFTIYILPVDTENPMIYYNLIVASGIFVYAIRGTYWSLLGDSKIEQNQLGTAVGFISLLGYLPDVLIPFFTSTIFENSQPENGYHNYFFFTAILGVIAIILVEIFKIQTQKKTTINTI